MVNNTANDGTPYFLTANHCLGNPGNWVYYFNHESATCTGNTGPTNQSISGGTLLVNSGQSDVALIELSKPRPQISTCNTPVGTHQARCPAARWASTTLGRFEEDLL